MLRVESFNFILQLEVNNIDSNKHTVQNDVYLVFFLFLEVLRHRKQTMGIGVVTG